MQWGFDAVLLTDFDRLAHWQDIVRKCLVPEEKALMFIRWSSAGGSP